MIRIAYLTGRAFRGAPTPPGVLPGYEAPDFELMRAAGARVGVAFEPAYWDAPDLAARGYAAALIRSCWDYTGQAERFIAMLEAHAAAGLPIFNPPETVRWNARKTYLNQLAAAGAPVIETIWVERADARSLARAFDDLDAAELVVKPQIGAGSQATLRLKRGQWSEADLALGPQGPAMIQPFLPSIETEGEMSLLFFGGEFSHAVRKTPVPGGWFANDLAAKFEAFDPDAELRTLARCACAAAPAEMLYARVDLVRAPAGDWRVIELELIEPYLFLALAPEGADLLTRALVMRLEAGPVLSE